MAVWPASLPQLPLPGYDVYSEPNTVESEVGNGPPKRRRRSTRERHFQTTNMEFTGTQKAVFDEFWEVINHGVLPFEWSDLATGDTVNFRFVKKPRFKNLTPAADPDVRWYATTLELEIV